MENKIPPIARVAIRHHGCEVMEPHNELVAATFPVFAVNGKLLACMGNDFYAVNDFERNSQHVRTKPKHAAQRIPQSIRRELDYTALSRPYVLDKLPYVDALQSAEMPQHGSRVDAIVYIVQADGHCLGQFDTAAAAIAAVSVPGFANAEDVEIYRAAYKRDSKIYVANVLRWSVCWNSSTKLAAYNTPANYAPRY